MLNKNEVEKRFADINQELAQVESGSEQEAGLRRELDELEYAAGLLHFAKKDKQEGKG